MKEFEAIKQYYTPIQPTIKAGHGDIVYIEDRPVREIENFVYCFWRLRTRQPLNRSYDYRVVSDGCIDIFFDRNRPSENFVTGFCRRYTTFSIGKTFDYIGIRFLPSAFPLLFQVDAKNLSNRSQELNQVLSELSDWITANIRPLQSFEKITECLTGQLQDITEEQNLRYDRRFFSALNLIFEKNGFLDTEKELNTGLSPRQLRRIFNYYIGTTAKTFSNVVRFQHILKTSPSTQSLKENKPYLDVGFFDQAHFIKNFNAFYGVTPSEAFR